MAEHRCHRCGTALRSDTLICPECGARQHVRTRQVRCRHCGRHASAELTLCPSCGRILQPAAPPWRAIAAGILAVALVLLFLVGRETVANAAISPVRRFLSSLLRPLPPLVAITTPTETIGFEPDATLTAMPPATSIPLTLLPAESPSPESVDLSVTPTPTIPDGFRHYRVRSGDNLFSIAREFGVTEEAIIEANGLLDPDNLQVNQNLIIPLPSPTSAPTHTPEPTLAPTASPTPTMHPTTTATLPPTAPVPEVTATPTFAPTTTVTEAANEALLYKVRAGDSVFSIARRFGVTEDAIIEANHLENPNALQVDQPLIVPKPLVTPTPDATLAYPAPALLAPDTGSTISDGAEAKVELAWESVGTLAADEWYVVSVFYLSGEQTQVTENAVKGTSWRVLRSLHGLADAPEHLYLWCVTVVRLGADDDAVPLSPPSITRDFRWP